VTVSANGISAPSRGWLGALRKSMPRDEFFAGLYILGCASGFVGRMIQEAAPSGIWSGTILHISTIPLFAAIAGVSLLLRDKSDEIRPADLVVAAVFLIFVVFSIGALNWVAVTGLSLYILFFTNAGSLRKRAAIILLALTASMLWSRVLFALFAHPILQIDASLVAWILGTERVGTLVHFADGSGEIAILPACSSIANLSLGFLCWVSVTQLLKERLSREDILWCVLSCASVIAINVTRISIMGLSHWHYSLLHGYWGDLISNIIMIGLLAGFAIMGTRRELFSRA
jgi:hypothetical protein